MLASLTHHAAQPIGAGYVGVGGMAGSSAAGTDEVCQAHAVVAIARLQELAQATVLAQAKQRASEITIRVLP